MNITPGGAQPIQTLKAQQAWEARRAVRSAEKQTAPVTTPSIEITKPNSLPAEPLASTAPAGTSPWTSPQWTRKVQEIQTIAAKSGFIGVSEQDIWRAYSQGNSLLADYRV
jgi:hypothetical protein